MERGVNKSIINVSSCWVGDMGKHFDHWKKDTFAGDVRLAIVSIWMVIEPIYTAFLS